MDLQSLNIFIQVAELNSFTRAAEKLGYSQPTISFQIKQLEKELGVQLFDRVGHTVSLTEAGKSALHYAQSICQLSQEMVMGDKKYDVNGIVRIAMAESLVNPLIATTFSDIKSKYPQLSINIMTGMTAELFDLLNHNEVDLICVLDSPVRDTSYIVVNEEEINVHIVVSKNNPLATKKNIKIDDLLSQSFILTEKGMSYRRLFDEEMAKHKIEILPILEMSNPKSICNLVKEDLGISFLPDFVTNKAVEEGSIVRLHVKGLDIKIWKQLLYHRDKWVNSQMKALIQHLSNIHIQNR